MRILTVDARVVLSPAAPEPAPARPRAGGRRLAGAVRSIAEGEEILAEVRRQAGYPRTRVRRSSGARLP